MCQWLFDTCAGIRGEGENRFAIAPVPGGTMTYAEAAYESPYGKITSTWKIENGKTHFAFEVPVNCTAEIRLPNGKCEKVTAGRYSYEV